MQAVQVVDSRRQVAQAQHRRQPAEAPALLQPLTAGVVPTRWLQLVLLSAPSMAAARVAVLPTHLLTAPAAVRCSAVVAVVTVEAKRRARRSLRLLAAALRLRVEPVAQLGLTATLRQLALAGPMETSSVAVKVGAVAGADRLPLLVTVRLVVPVEFAVVAAEEGVLLMFQASVARVESAVAVRFL